MPLNAVHRKLILGLLCALVVAAVLAGVNGGFLVIALALGDSFMTAAFSWSSGILLGLVGGIATLLTVVLAVDRLSREE